MLLKQLTPILIVALCSSACTPTHTRDTTEKVARQAGIIDRFEIKRWHHRQISRDSKILVSLSADTDLDADRVVQTIAKNLSEHFAQVDSLPGERAKSRSRQLALESHYQFLLDVTQLTWEKARKRTAADATMTDDNSMDNSAADTTGSADPDHDDGASAINSIAIECVLLDVASNRAVDKIVIVANPSWLRDRGGNIEQVLGSAIAHLGENLAGP